MSIPASGILPASFSPILENCLLKAVAIVLRSVMVWLLCEIFDIRFSPLGFRVHNQLLYPIPDISNIFTVCLEVIIVVFSFTVISKATNFVAVKPILHVVR